MKSGSVKHEFSPWVKKEKKLNNGATMINHGNGLTRSKASIFINWSWEYDCKSMQTMVYTVSIEQKWRKKSKGKY